MTNPWSEWSRLETMGSTINPNALPGLYSGGYGDPTDTLAAMSTALDRLPARLKAGVLPHFSLVLAPSTYLNARFATGSMEGYTGLTFDTGVGGHRIWLKAGATVFTATHEWGHLVDAEVNTRTGAYARFGHDWQTLWGAMAQGKAEGKISSTVGGYAYAWTNASEFFADTFAGYYTYQYQTATSDSAGAAATLSRLGTQMNPSALGFPCPNYLSLCEATFGAIDLSGPRTPTLVAV